MVTKSVVFPSSLSLLPAFQTHLIKVVESFKQVPAPDTASITPSLLETYSRLLVWLGTRNFQCMQAYYSCRENPSLPTHLYTHTHTYTLHSSPHPSCVQISSLGCSPRTPRDHCVSCPPSAPVLLPFPAAPTATHCRLCLYHTKPALQLHGECSTEADQRIGQLRLPHTAG